MSNPVDEVTEGISSKLQISKVAKNKDGQNKNKDEAIEKRTHIENKNNHGSLSALSTTNRNERPTENTNKTSEQDKQISTQRETKQDGSLENIAVKTSIIYDRKKQALIEKTSVIYDREEQTSTEKNIKKRTRRRKQKDRAKAQLTDQITKSNSKQSDPHPGDPHPDSRKRKNKRRLERCYGHFHCRECDLVWTSAWTWRFQGTLIVRFRQQCNTCREWRFPFRTEYLKCRVCGLPVPECECPESDYDDEELEKPPHRGDLCEKCQTATPCRAARHYR